jgi:hypothetical protein
LIVRGEKYWRLTVKGRAALTTLLALDMLRAADEYDEPPPIERVH